MPLTPDAAVIEPHCLQVEILIEQLRIIIKALKRFDDEIALTAQKLPDYDLLFSPLPGAAKVLAPRLLAAFGCDLNRSMQHLNSNYREGGVVYEVLKEKIFHSSR